MKHTFLICKLIRNTKPYFQLTANIASSLYDSSPCSFYLEKQRQLVNPRRGHDKRDTFQQDLTINSHLNKDKKLSEACEQRSIPTNVFQLLRGTDQRLGCRTAIVTWALPSCSRVYLSDCCRLVGCHCLTAGAGSGCRGPRGTHSFPVGKLEFQRTAATLWRWDENTAPTAAHLLLCFLNNAAKTIKHKSSSLLNGFPSLKVEACLFAKYHNKNLPAVVEVYQLFKQSIYLMVFGAQGSLFLADRGVCGACICQPALTSHHHTRCSTDLREGRAGSNSAWPLPLKTVFLLISAVKKNQCYRTITFIYWQDAFPWVFPWKNEFLKILWATQTVCPLPKWSGIQTAASVEQVPPPAQEWGRERSFVTDELQSEAMNYP